MSYKFVGRKVLEWRAEVSLSSPAKDKVQKAVILDTASNVKKFLTLEP